MTREEAMETLGLSGNPTLAEINRAYTECAKKYHPDLYATQLEPVREVMNEKMRRVNLARESLLREAPPDPFRAGAPHGGEDPPRDEPHRQSEHEDARRARRGTGVCGWTSADGRRCPGAVAPDSTSYCRLHMADPHAIPDGLRCTQEGRWHRCSAISAPGERLCDAHAGPQAPTYSHGPFIPAGFVAQVVRGKVRLVPLEEAWHHDQGCFFVLPNGDRCSGIRRSPSVLYCEVHENPLNRLFGRLF